MAAGNNEQEYQRIKMHRVGMFQPDTLSSINCMALNEEKKQLAVVRRVMNRDPKLSSSISLIEIFNMMNEKHPFVQQVIHDSDNDLALIESVAWGRGNRLFSCGLNSNVNEYDLVRSVIKKSYSVTGSAWCMDFDKSRRLMAVGTEEGHVSVFGLDDDDETLNYEDKKIRNDGRILSIAWYQHKEQTYLVTGSIRFIKIWDYKSEACIESISVSTDETIIWCLKVIRDFVIVSGDSTGATSFWDGHTATLLHSDKLHKSDVLTLCPSADEGCIYSAGVDPVIVTHNINLSNNRIMPGVARHIHSHDVRSLVCTSKNWLYSGGIDSFLCRSFYPPKIVVTSWPHFMRLVDSHGDIVMFQQLKRLQLVKLAEVTDGEQASDGDRLSLGSNLINLAAINSKKYIRCSALFGDWIAYATEGKVVIIHRTTCQLTRVKFEFDMICDVLGLKFCGHEFLAVNTGTNVTIVKLCLKGSTIKLVIENKRRIKMMTATENYLAVCVKRNILIYDTINFKLISTVSINAPTTAIRINPFNGSQLVIAFSNRLTIFDIETSKSHTLLVKESQQFYPIKGIAFTEYTILLYDDVNLYNVSDEKGLLSVIDQFEHIVKVDNLCPTKSDELFVVEMKRSAFVKSLPPPFAKKLYGT